MKKVLSVVLCICMLITGVPLVSLAADDPVKIVSVTANDNQVFDSDQIKVEFTGPTDAETVNYFTVELCYTYETNGHPYKVRRRSCREPGK